MAATKTAEKPEAEKKVVITDLNVAIGELKDVGYDVDALRAGITDGTIVAEIDTVEIEAGKFSGDYVSLSLGPNADSDEKVLKALTVLAGGRVTAPMLPAEEGKEPEPDKKAPSLVKAALYGVDLAFRSRTSQRIKAAAQGPEKAIERMAEMIVKNKPGTSKEQALDMARALLAD